MDNFRIDTIRELRNFFIRNGYRVSHSEYYSNLSFDIIGKNEKEVIIIKVLYNVDTLRPESSDDLKKLARSFDAIAVVVGGRSGTGYLEDEIVYFRHGIPIMTLNTIEKYIEGDRPSTFSAPGGYYVQINGERMHEARIKLGMSIGYISNKIGVSRRSISLYESGTASTMEVYRKLKYLLQTDISNEIDLKNAIECESNFPEPEDPLFSEVDRLLVNLGLIPEFFTKLPFDATATGDSWNGLLGIFQNMMVQTERIKMIRESSEVLDVQPLIISKESSSKERIGGCPVITVNTISDLKDQDELMKKITRLKGD
ncbi:helix-turn-helix domain-containing protein [Caldiplasma sukawensis]